MIVDQSILHFLLGGQVEAQSIILGAYMDPPENFEQGPVTPENAKPRRMVQFGRALIKVRDQSTSDLADNVKTLIDAYDGLAVEAAAAGDETAAVDYHAYANMLKAFITLSTQ